MPQCGSGICLGMFVQLYIRNEDQIRFSSRFSGACLGLVMGGDMELLLFLQTPIGCRGKTQARACSASLRCRGESIQGPAEVVADDSVFPVAIRPRRPW